MPDDWNYDVVSIDGWEGMFQMIEIVREIVDVSLHIFCLGNSCLTSFKFYYLIKECYTI